MSLSLPFASRSEPTRREGIVTAAEPERERERKRVKERQRERTEIPRRLPGSPVGVPSFKGNTGVRPAKEGEKRPLFKSPLHPIPLTHVHPSIGWIRSHNLLFRPRSVGSVYWLRVSLGTDTRTHLLHYSERERDGRAEESRRERERGKDGKKMTGQRNHNKKRRRRGRKEEKREKKEEEVEDGRERKRENRPRSINGNCLAVAKSEEL